MDAATIEAQLSQVRTLPDGPARGERLEELAAAARTGPDRAAEGRVLLELADFYSRAGEGNSASDASRRLLRVYDDHPAELGAMTWTTHRHLRQMAQRLIDDPAVPLPTVRHWLDEMERRYRQCGYSIRPVCALRAALARETGEAQAAAEWLAVALAARRDGMSDCDACERNKWGVVSEFLGDDEAALAHWQPLLDGERSCGQEPDLVLAQALLPLVRTGRVAAARDAHLAGYPLVRHAAHRRSGLARHIEFCALTGNEARGLEILADHAHWLTDTSGHPATRLAFATGVCVLLRRLVTLGLGDLPLGQSAVEPARADLEVEIGALCARYDARNGTSVVSLRTAARLAAKPLPGGLPLGVRSRLPGASDQTAASAVPDDFCGDRLAEVRRLADLAAARLSGAPEEAEAHLREALALGAGVLPAERLARLGAQLVIAVASQPGRPLDLADAAVRAAARWEGVSESGVLHHTLVAARAFHRADRHGAAVALFEQALAGLDLPYPAAELAVVRGQFGRSLAALDRHHEAARQFTEGARLIERDPERAELRADLTGCAAVALERCARADEAVTAYRREELAASAECSTELSRPSHPDTTR